jgi:hypothetical protein
MPDARPIKQPCRIITEGYADSAFLNALIKNRGIANCEAECTRSDKEPQRCAGKNATAITDTVRSLVSFSELNPGKLRGIVLAVDIDDDSKKTLTGVKDALKSVKPPVSCPTDYLEIKKEKKAADFAVAIMGIPWHDQLGNLDTLLLESLQPNYSDVIAPLATFCDLTKKRRDGWTLGNNSRMKLRCTIAVTYRPDPGQSLGIMLDRTEIPLFNLQDGAFNQIAKFLEYFQQNVLGN